MVRQAVTSLKEMPRGLPRPLAKVNAKKIIDRWGPKWSCEIYPWPYTAGNDYIGNSDMGRPRECCTEKKCGNCGEAVVEDEVFLIISNAPGQDFLWEESGPFHKKCVLQVLLLCPAISQQVIPQREKNGRFSGSIQRYEVAIANWSEVADYFEKYRY